MEEEAQNRRLFLAVAVSLLVVTLFPFGRKTSPPAVGPDAGVVATSTQTQAPATLSAVTGTVTPVAAVMPMPSVEPSLYEFEGAVEVDDQVIPFQVALTNIGGGIEKFVLPNYFERSPDNRATDEPISLANATADAKDAAAGQFGQAAAIGFGDETTFDMPPRMHFEVVEETENKVRYLFRTAEGVEIEREYAFKRDSFQIEMAITIRNRSRRRESYRLQTSTALAVNAAMKQGSGFLSGMLPPPDHLQTQCFTDGDVERASYREVIEEPEKYSEAVRWIAVDRQFFLGAIIARGAETGECELETKDEVARASMLMPLVKLEPGESRRHMFTAYFGVKKPSLLTRVDAGLEGAIDYTLFGGLNLAPLCTVLLWILGIIYSLTGSWGIAIIGLTILVKLVLFPLNQRSMKSMRALSALKPEMDKLREKYKGDQQRQNEEMIRLYREHNVNPAGGCLPLLLQMPIMFALYRALWASVDLYQQEFLWVSDLTTRDPFWILPLTLVAVMFIQQKTTPTTMDPAQQRVMLYMMPLMFGFFMAALPAGLCLYILANTVLTIAQQHLINRTIGPVGGPPSVQEAKA